MWGEICKVIGKEEWIEHPNYKTPNARLSHLKQIFDEIERWSVRDRR